jgi:hypothetical protein
MAHKKEKRAANDHAVGSCQPPVALAAFTLSPTAAQRENIYVNVKVVQIFWEAGAQMSWGDVHHLSHGWHLSLDRVLVPPVLASYHAR